MWKKRLVTDRQLNYDFPLVVEELRKKKALLSEAEWNDNFSAVERLKIEIDVLNNLHNRGEEYIIPF